MPVSTMAGSYKLWAALVVLRFIWCFWPQTGYVDPAEFFEGTSTLASRIFGFQSTAAPGYDTPKPQTTIFFPYITAGFGFHACKKLGELGVAPINERTLVIAPRVMMTVVSLISDACIYNIATILGQNAGACLMIFASSFATLVFLTRNMTHAISATTFALMLLLVVDSRKSQLAPKPNRVKAEKKLIQKAKKSDPNHGFWLGVFILEGSFNHPSFFIFSLIPMMFWLTGSATHFGPGAVKVIISNAASLLPGILTMGTFLIILDSTFYRTLDAQILINPQLLMENLNADLMKNLTVVPLNFLQYNFFHSPLEFNPQTTHFLFNMPVLFFPLIVSFLSEVYMVYSGRAGQDSKTFTSSTSRAFFALSFTTPLLIFSLLPIQDPKLLLPILIPLVLLYAESVILPSTGMPNAPWIVWNVAFGFIFGVVLQGGVIPALGHIKSTVTAPVVEQPIIYHYVFYRTPTPPEYLLALPPPGSDITWDNLSHQFVIHDLGDADRTKLHQTIGSLMDSDRLSDAKRIKKEVYVVAPASIDVLFCRINVKFVYKYVKRFTPHMSLDIPPYLFPDYTCQAEKMRSYSRMGLRDRIPALFSLNLYKVELVRHFGGEDMAAFNNMHQKKPKYVNQ